MKRRILSVVVFCTLSLMIGGAAMLLAGAPLWLGAVIVGVFWMI